MDPIVGRFQTAPERRIQYRLQGSCQRLYHMPAAQPVPGLSWRVSLARGLAWGTAQPVVPPAVDTSAWYICPYVYIYPHIFIYLYVYVYTFYISTGIYAYLHISIYIHGVYMYIDLFRYTCIREYIHTYIQTYRHTDIHTDIQTYIHTRIHTRIHTHRRALGPAWPRLLCNSLLCGLWATGLSAARAASGGRRGDARVEPPKLEEQMDPKSVYGPHTL